MLDQRGVTLLAALHAFFQEHQYCGDLDSGVDGDRIGMHVRASHPRLKPSDKREPISRAQR